jgi:hypothetical protein
MLFVTTITLSQQRTPPSSVDRNPSTEEGQTIASLLGTQTAAVGGFMYFLH